MADDIVEEETHWRCSRCARPVPIYVGRCPGCRLVNTLRIAAGPCPELPSPKKKPNDPFAGLGRDAGPRVTVEDAGYGAQPIGDVERDFEPVERLLTNVPSLDLVLGPHDHGAARGAVVLVSGRQGSGKSTLLMQSLAGAAERGETALYASGEQTKTEVFQYAERLGLLSDAVRRHLIVLHTRSYEEFEDVVATHDPVAVVLDSLNVFGTLRADGNPGDTKVAIAIMDALYDVTVERKLATFAVSQVTKDGDLAGSNAVQHKSHVIAKMRVLVDPIERYQLEEIAGRIDAAGEPVDFVEVCCPEKNRFGKRGIRGHFVVGESGLLQSIEVPNQGSRRRRRDEESGEPVF
jgi:DNA repair protein RadA/Sms